MHVWCYLLESSSKSPGSVQGRTRERRRRPLVSRLSGPQTNKLVARRTMSVALQAALTLLGEKNHPSIMQTSAEQLITILSNIASNPEEKKYRKLKLTNRVVAEKVLPAKGAKPLLQAVGFGQVRARSLTSRRQSSAACPQVF